MVELRSTGSGISLSPTTWMLTLELATICGWEPGGTRDGTGPDSVDALQDVRHLMCWQTEYLSNDGLTVTSTDALKLADALAKAAVNAEQILIDWNEGRFAPPKDIRTTPGGFKWFTTAEGQTHLRNLSGFCRRGAFQIF